MLMYFLKIIDNIIQKKAWKQRDYVYEKIITRSVFYFVLFMCKSLDFEIIVHLIIRGSIFSLNKNLYSYWFAIVMMQKIKQREEILTNLSTIVNSV